MKCKSIEVFSGPTCHLVDCDMRWLILDEILNFLCTSSCCQILIVQIFHLLAKVLIESQIGLPFLPSFFLSFFTVKLILKIYSIVLHVISWVYWLQCGWRWDWSNELYQLLPPQSHCWRLTHTSKVVYPFCYRRLGSIGGCRTNSGQARKKIYISPVAPN